MPRLFFALWPDAVVRDELCAAARRVQSACGGRATRRDNLHQTLVFLGDVARENMPRLEAAAGTADARAFMLDFGVSGYWPHNRVVWAAPHTSPASLTGLVAALERALTQAGGFTFDRRTYAPHITLVRGARAPTTLPALRFTWTVHDFVLVESGRGPRGAAYRVIARWPLTA